MFPGSLNSVFKLILFTEMDEIKYSKKEIAEFFSLGSFEVTFSYLSDSITWNIVGEKVFEGKAAVVANCDQTRAYFNTVQTDFRIDNIIAEDNQVVVRGTAAFMRDGKQINYVSACDVYEFNDHNQLERISSYCIPEKRES